MLVQAVLSGRCWGWACTEIFSTEISPFVVEESVCISAGETETVVEICEVLITSLLSVDDPCSQSSSLGSHLPLKLHITTAFFSSVPGQGTSNSLPLRSDRWVGSPVKFHLSHSITESETKLWVHRGLYFPHCNAKVEML